MFLTFVLLISSCVDATPIQYSTYTDSEIGVDRNNAAALQSDMLLDVEKHSKPGATSPYVHYGSGTWAHEGNHQISTELCLKHGCYGPDGYEFFCAWYVKDGQYVKFDQQPKIVRRETCAEYLPSSLKVGRYQHYFVDVVSHPAHSNPLYILEEWNAYITGGTTVVEVTRAGLHDKNKFQNDLQGPVEFAIFFSACLAAFLDREPAYLDAPNVKPFVKFNMERSFAHYHGSRDFKDLHPGLEDQEYAAFMTDPQAEKLRQAFKTIWGDQWYADVVEGGNGGKIPDVVPAPQPGMPAKEPVNDVIPDDVLQNASFNPNDYTFEGLGLDASKGPKDHKKHDINAKPELPPVMFSYMTCFPAVARSNVELLQYNCNFEPLGQLAAGDLVVQKYTSRVWDNEPACGYGWLADVIVYKQDGTKMEAQVRSDELIIFAQPFPCDQVLKGKIAHRGDQHDPTADENKPDVLGFREQNNKVLASSASVVTISVVCIALMLILAI